MLKTRKLDSIHVDVSIIDILTYCWILIRYNFNILAIDSTSTNIHAQCAGNGRVECLNDSQL